MGCSFSAKGQDMGTYFSDIIEKAVEDLYYCYDNDRAGEAADRLAGCPKRLPKGRQISGTKLCHSGKERPH
jgi:hypothetical protein